MQLTLSVSSTLFVIVTQIPVYILATGAYKETISGNCIALNEILTCIFFSMLALPYISNQTYSKEKIATYCIKIVLAALIVNIGSSVLLTFKTLRNWIRRRIEKMRVKSITVTDEIKNEKEVIVSFKNNEGN